MTDITGDFVHLHVHTEYSLLDGQSRIKQLIERAQELQQSAVGITDHGVMFGVIDFYRAAKDTGVKPIIGMEAYLAPRGMEDKEATFDKKPYHMLLLARNQTGYQNLLHMASEAQLRGYYYRPRIDKDFMQRHSEGIIATSGCLAAEIPRMIEDGREAEARDLIGWYQDVFGEDNFYLELQGHKIEQLDVLNKWLFEYRKSNHSTVQFLATNDVHYVRASDADTHDTLLCIQTSAHKDETNRMRLEPHGSYYLKSAQEMFADFRHYNVPEWMIQESFENSLKIADMCDVNLDTEGYHLPVFPVPSGFTEGDYLHYLVDIGLSWRFPGNENDPILCERLERELRIIGDMGFNTYFLIVWDLCEFARHADIWWNVRGSGAGSLVAYCLGITNIDPIQNSLLFERFLNPGRVSMPDIDLDYPDDRRADMIRYTAQKYGEDKVAAIITFGTMGAKASVRDVGRALSVDLAKINQAASLIPQEARQKKIADYIDADPELRDMYENDTQIKAVMNTAIELQGMTRHASTHAAGIIVSDKPLVQYLPLHRITGTDPSGGALKAVTQFPMETAESIGLLKVDFLGLSTLTILRKACDLINHHRGTPYTMDNIPYRHDDTRHTLSDEQHKMLNLAFEMMGRGETIGVFQVESPGMQSMLRGMRPKTFENIIAGISLYRPGPMEFIPRYNERLHGEPFDYAHLIDRDQHPDDYADVLAHLNKVLGRILNETYGIIVYQEQIMQIAGDIFGYELGEADLMRRAVSKKKQEALLKHKDIFKERGPANGIPEDVAEKIFDEIEFFANYGFNKSHASDYAVITVQTAFLKCHYPEEFMTALLCVHFDDSAKVANFLAECRRLHIPVLPPNVNYSQLDFDIEIVNKKRQRRGIRFGLAAVKNASVNAIQYLIERRTEAGPFTSLEDFCHRVDTRKLGKRTLESLIKVGAFDDFAERDILVNGLERIMGFSTEYHKAQDTGQLTLFGAMGDEMDKLQLPTLGQDERTKRRDMLRWEKELLGLYVTGRPVDRHRELFASKKLDVIAHLQASVTEIEEQDIEMDAETRKSMLKKLERPVSVAGEVTAIRRITTRNNDSMAVMTLEDWHETSGTIEVVMFPYIWDRVRVQFEDRHEKNADYATTLEEGEIVAVSGMFDTSRNEPQIKAENVTTDFTYISATIEQENYQGQYNSEPTSHYWDTPANGNEPYSPEWADEPPPPTEFYDEPPASYDYGANHYDYDEETGEIAAPVADDDIPPNPHGIMADNSWTSDVAMPHKINVTLDDQSSPDEDIKTDDEPAKISNSPFATINNHTASANGHIDHNGHIDPSNNGHAMRNNGKNNGHGQQHEVGYHANGRITHHPISEAVNHTQRHNGKNGQSQQEDPFKDLKHMSDNNLPSPDKRRHMQIIFPRSDSAQRDRRRLRHIFNACKEFPGHDSFTIVIRGEKRSDEMAFPNDTTKYCDELLAKLIQIVDEGNIIVTDADA